MSFRLPGDHTYAIQALRGKFTQLEDRMALLNSEVQACNVLAAQLLQVISDLETKGTSSLEKIGTMILQGQKRLITDRVKE